MPKRKAKDVIKAAMDPEDDPSAPPRQSVSEQQVIDDHYYNYRLFVIFNALHSI